MRDNLFTLAFDIDGNENLIYFGRAFQGASKASAVWQIRKFLYSGTVLTDMQWADGDTQFNNVWDNRASLSYS